MVDQSLQMEKLVAGDRNFRGVMLAGSDFSGMNLRNVDFGNADLSDCNFNRCSLHNANFSRANLQNATFFDAKLVNANLSQANLNNANLGYADLQRATVAEANVFNTNMVKADLRGTDLRVYQGIFDLMGPWNSMILNGAIYNSSTKAQTNLSRHGAIRELLLPFWVLRQGFSFDLSHNAAEQSIYRKAADIWITGSFYLFSLILIVTLLGVFSQIIPWQIFVGIIVSGLLALVVIATLILRHVGDLDQENFVELIIAVLKKLPIFGKSQ